MSDQAQGQSQSVEQRMAAFFSPAPKEQPAETQAPEPQQADTTPEVEEVQPPAASEQAQDDDGEPTVDDLEAAADDDAPRVANDVFEIVVDGKAEKVGRDEVIELAQKGRDYTRKTQQLSEDRVRIQQYAQAVQRTAELQTALTDDIAEIKSLQKQLAAFPATPEAWLAYSQSDPVAAFQIRTQYDALNQQMQQRQQAIQAKAAELQGAHKAISAEELRAEFRRAQDAVPRWRDETKFKQDAANIRDHLLKRGYTAQEADGLADGRALVIAWEAAQYAKLVANRDQRVKQARQAPPVTKPGVAGGVQETAERKKTDEMRQKLKKSGDWRDAAALLARRTVKG